MGLRFKNFGYNFRRLKPAAPSHRRSGFRIRPPRPGDEANLTRIAIAAKRHWGYADKWIRAWTKSLTITPDILAKHPIAIATVATKPVGFCVVDIRGEVGFLAHLWVLPEFMGRGLGRMLFARAEKLAVAKGATLLRLESDPHAEAFYLKMGAVVVGRAPAPLGKIRDRFLPVMEKKLRHPTST